jgi:hypothetical protein
MNHTLELIQKPSDIKMAKPDSFTALCQPPFNLCNICSLSRVSLWNKVVCVGGGGGILTLIFSRKGRIKEGWI